MSTRIVCDGCGRTLRDHEGPGGPAITGTRSDGWQGGELPGDTFHWCRDCAIIAFRAVKAAKAVPPRVLKERS